MNNTVRALAAILLLTACGAEASSERGLPPAPVVELPTETPSNAPPALQLPADLLLPHSAEAMDDLREELLLCGSGLDHVGSPYEYRTLPAPEVPHAAETLQWHIVSVDPPEALVTVARLDNVVYLVDHRTEARLAEQAVLRREVVRWEKEVGSFALELCLRGFGRGCQELPG